MRTNIVFSLISAGTLLVGGLAAAAPQPVSPRVVHVVVALCDNEHQGIVPVPAALGNGQEPAGQSAGF